MNRQTVKPSNRQTPPAKPPPAKSPEWEAAERAFGCVFSSFTRIAAGKSSHNFRAVSQDDGRSYFVKITKPYRIERILKRLGAISSPIVAGLAFGGATGTFGKDAICALEWCREGDNIPPHMLTGSQIQAIATGYREISRALSVVDRSLLKKIDGLDEAAARCGIAPQPIHGDFHYQNYYLRGDKLTSCYDLESMRLGLPTEDLLRIFAHAIERTRCWRFARLNALYRRLSEMARVSGYPSELWEAAVELHRTYKCARRNQKSSFPLASLIDNWFRAPYYRRLLRAVKSRGPAHY